MKKQRSGWKGESRRHSLARKGVKTVLPDGRRFDVSKFVANGEKQKSDYYLDGVDAGEYSAIINLGEDQKELFDAYENDELGQIVSEIREVQTQYSGDISYDVKFFDEDIEVVEWLNDSDDMKLFDEDYAVEKVIKKFNIDERDAERIVSNWKNGGISVEDYDEYEDGFYEGFYRTVRYAYLDEKLRGVYDNGGESADRFSVILKDGSLIGMSERPFHPQGFNQYAGNIDNWDLTTLDHLGKRVSLRDIPDVVVDAIEKRIGE